MSETTICRHRDCEKRFTLSRYGNRTHTSEKTRSRHLFCSPKCRVAHHRRLAALRGGVTAPGGATGVQGSVTAPEINQQNQWDLPPNKNDRGPHLTLPGRGDPRQDLSPRRVPAHWLRLAQPQRANWSPVGSPQRQLWPHRAPDAGAVQNPQAARDRSGDRSRP
jgi:hypothetical protein